MIAHGGIKSIFKDYRKKIILSNLDPEAEHHLGGVAAATTVGRSLAEVEPKTTDFKTARV